MGPGVIFWGLKKGRTQSGSAKDRNVGSGLFVAGFVKYRAQIGSVYGAHVASPVSLGSEQAQDQPGSAKGPNVGSGIVFRGLSKRRVQLCSAQCPRYAPRGVVGVMHKGRTQPDSVHGPRSGPRSTYSKPEEQMYAKECLLKALSTVDSALFTAAT